MTYVAASCDGNLGEDNRCEAAGGRKGARPDQGNVSPAVVWTSIELRIIQGTNVGTFASLLTHLNPPCQFLPWYCYHEPLNLYCLASRIVANLFGAATVFSPT